ncbi:hypothetical protein GCWU000246_00055 [Jonquetella anthropi E3_33 E1]|nr:hypothetical protein GCWU000246_00055 [Jonquetella anthropi E3_33 E1]
MSRRLCGRISPAPCRRAAARAGVNFSGSLIQFLILQLFTHF